MSPDILKTLEYLQNNNNNQIINEEINIKKLLTINNTTEKNKSLCKNPKDVKPIAMKNK